MRRDCPPEGGAQAVGAEVGRLLEAIPAGVIAVDEKGRIVLANSRIDDIFGHRRDSLIGKSVEILIPRPLRGGHARRRRVYASAPEARDCGHGRELTGLRRDGTVIPVEVGLRPFTTADGRNLTLAIILDISARKRAEEALRASEARYRRIVETTHEAFGEIDISRRMVSFNERMNEMFGYSGKQLMGLDIIESLVSPEDRENLLNQLRLRKKGRADSYEQRFVKKNGDHIWALVTGTPIFDDNGAVRGSFAMMTDITDSVRAREAEETVARAHACKEMLADLSHELRTPIATLRTAAETFLRRGLSGPRDTPAILKSIGHQTERLSKLVNNLIQLSGRDFTSDAAAPPERFSLSGLVADCVRDLSFLAGEKGLLLRGKLSPDIAIRANRDDVRQAVENLIDNAIQYNRPGGKIEVTLRRERGAARLRVRDTGVGIGKKEAPKLFTRFQRTRRARRMNPAGTGLGLSIVQQVVDAIGGRVSMKSRPGVGTVFDLSFPK